MLSYIKARLKERFTWIGICGWIFYAIYHTDINYLVHAITHAPKTVDTIIVSLPGIVSGLMILLRTK